MEKNSLNIKEKIGTIVQILDEKQRRLVLAAEAKSLGHRRIKLDPCQYGGHKNVEKFSICADKTANRANVAFTL